MNTAAIEWRVELPSTLEAVERFCGQFRSWPAVKTTDLDVFSSELVLREVLTNSVVHGCGENPALRVCCVLRMKRGRLLIAVKDQGDGFDWRAAWDRRAAAPDSHGRGMEILHRYANWVRFNFKGNSVVLVKRYLAGKTNEQ